MKLNPAFVRLTKFIYNTHTHVMKLLLQCIHVHVHVAVANFSDASGSHRVHVHVLYDSVSRSFIHVVLSLHIQQSQYKKIY